MAWTLWQSDLTDRSLDPVADSAGDDPVQGLATLWRRTLDEGLHSDGTARKSAVFWLEEAETKVRVQLVTAHPGRPQETLGRLRRLWKDASEAERDALAAALGRFHHARRGVPIDLFHKDLAPLVTAAKGVADLAAALEGGSGP